MKRLNLSILIILLCTILVETTHGESIPGGGIKVTLKIIWGRIPTCTGWGICGVLVGTPDAMASIQTDATESKYWTLNITKQYLQMYESDLLPLFDKQNSLTFHDTFVFPEEIKVALGRSTDLIIQGNRKYPMKYENGEYIITFSD